MKVALNWLRLVITDGLFSCFEDCWTLHDELNALGVLKNKIIKSGNMIKTIGILDEDISKH